MSCHLKITVITICRECRITHRQGKHMTRSQEGQGTHGKWCPEYRGKSLRWSAVRVQGSPACDRDKISVAAQNLK